MCQILFSESANPPREAIVDANEMNADGFGFAFVKDKQVEWNKGYEKSQLTDEVIDYYLSLPVPKAIHFRLATHGGTSAQLTHPFPIKRGVPHDLRGKAGAVLFHNGVWHMYDDRLREAILGGTVNPNILKGGLSDSRAMAILAQRFGLEFLDVLNLGSNKILILHETGTIQYGDWTEKEGWSASNSRIFRVKPKSQSEPTGSGLAEKGVPLGPNGLPLSAAERIELARKGHLNRHGNLRSKFRGSCVSGERSLGPETRKVDVVGGDLGLESSRTASLYLSSTVQEIKDYQAQWGWRERMVN